MDTVREWLGVELDEVSFREKLVSAVGGAVAILAIFAISRHALGLGGAKMLVGSMGASAVLLFAVPHGALSQPWPVFGGQIVSAFIGVSCARFIGNTDLAAAIAVGLSIGVMHQCKFIHPPGGATALAAVIGGPAVRSLGYSFVWSPVLLNVLTMLAVAVAFNACFPWRRYPARLNRRHLAPSERPEWAHEEVLAALRTLDSFVDVTQDDLVRLAHLLSTTPKPYPDPDADPNPDPNPDPK